MEEFRGRPARAPNESNEALKARLRKAAQELREIAAKDPAKAADVLPMARRLEELANDPMAHSP
ncbi:MAG TPA: hypothetical protein VKY65_04555 [Alphaproteobacteria bacterium]|nr:hypothetical protein [Alphaproteobacteria bacterium]